MPKKIYLYSSISDYMAEYVNKQLDQSKESNSEINIRMLTRGGYTPAGIAMLTNIKQYPGKIKMSVDGDVSSMGAFMLLYADTVEMSSMAELMFHKAAYPKWYEPSENELENLNRENERFKEKMQEKLGEAGKELIEKVFAEGKRNDVYLTAKQAKEIGIVNDIIEISATEKAAMDNEFHKLMCSETEKTKQEVKQESNNNKMDKIELTPAELEKKLEDSASKALEAERQRVASWNVYAKVDPEAVKAGIESGDEISPSKREELMLKSSKLSAKESLKGDNAKDVETKTEEELQAQAEAEKKAHEESVARLERFKKQRKG